ncbi:hypothetical protein H2248_003821 [Termitomyces sp. 'cryptogamus']|nr:hypothetical protein H2248_003821 [Termitomyces sp. 'cryptogamus']
MTPAVFPAATPVVVIKPANLRGIELLDARRESTGRPQELRLQTIPNVPGRSSTPNEPLPVSMRRNDLAPPIFNLSILTRPFVSTTLTVLTTRPAMFPGRQQPAPKRSRPSSRQSASGRSRPVSPGELM